MWSAPMTLNRRVVTDGEKVFVTFGYNSPVTVLDAATGETLRTLENSDGADELILCEGILLALVRDSLSVGAKPKTKPTRRKNPMEWTIGAPGPGAIVAFDAQTGKQLWRSKKENVTVLTLAALNDRVCYHREQKLICLNLKTGKTQWQADCLAHNQRIKHSGGTLVMRDQAVLFTSSTGVAAFASKDGKKLWTGPKVTGPGITHTPDLFVAKGVVWGGNEPKMHSKTSVNLTRHGRDLMTGKVVKTIHVPKLISPLHHYRCYRSKATENFVLLTKRGVEFVDLEGDDHMRHDWLRAMCHYGFLPANGLLYFPPHHCFCYPGVKMTGFLALSGEDNDKVDTTGRLVKGPAFGKIRNPKSQIRNSDDWPTYRHDNLRSGSVRQTIPAKLKRTWSANLGGKISQPVVSGGKLYVAETQAHSIACLDMKSGRVLWRYTAGGPIDSPPTIENGLCLFGCRDGWVYCVTAAGGELVWRFRAAPRDKRIVSFEQLESPWPVPGSVLMLDGVAYVCAGRSSYLDGGVYLYGLEPQTGEVLYETKVDGPWPDVNKDVGRPFDMEGTKGDILVTDGQNIYLFQMTFDKTLKDITPDRATSLGDRISGRRLIASGGFVQDMWFDRTFWSYSNRWPGFYYANAAPKAGQILVFDDKQTYGLHVYTKRLRLSPAFDPGTGGYELFADDNDNEPILAKNSVGREKGPGFSRSKPPVWSVQIPLRVLAMVKAGDNLFLAGHPDVMPENDPYGGFEGRKGAELWVVSARDGSKRETYELNSMPRIDGLIAADGKLYMSTADGELVCFEAK